MSNTSERDAFRIAADFGRMRGDPINCRVHVVCGGGVTAFRREPISDSASVC